jgi:preprotein translocase subunit SecG
MAALLYSLVFAVVLGLLGADASNSFLKGIAYVLSGWMFLAAIILSVRWGKK